MILYVNGDSHSAGAQSVNDFAFANSDFRFTVYGKKPHPDNLDASFGMHLSKLLKLAFVCRAESGSSNERILRTTYDYIKDLSKADYVFVLIGWTNWTRTEFFDEQANEMIQINATFPDILPKHLQQNYKQYVANIDIARKQQEWHDKIYQLHLDLDAKGIPHLFFNANDDLRLIPENERKEWGGNFINPYDPKCTYIELCKQAGFVHNEWYHFKKDAHLFWAKYLFDWLTANKISV